MLASPAELARVQRVAKPARSGSIAGEQAAGDVSLETKRSPTSLQGLSAQSGGTSLRGCRAFNPSLPKRNKLNLVEHTAFNRRVGGFKSPVPHCKRFLFSSGMARVRKALAPRLPAGAYGGQSRHPREPIQEDPT